MQKLTFLLLLLMIVGTSVSAQIDQRLAAVKTPLKEVQSLQLPSLDSEALLETELSLREPGRAPRFAETILVDVSPNTHGTWELVDGNAVWRLRIPSPSAKSLNLGFDHFYMPRGASLILYSPNLQSVQGPFTPADNEEHDQLWTPIVTGDEVVIELSVPVTERENVRLHLKSVNHDFLGFSRSAVLSGSCNIDVVCSLADGWGIVDNYRDIIQSVAVISTGGGTFCTGFLVTNTRQDCAPLFMTADHCGIGPGNAASLVTYWNFENSECRAPGSPASGAPGDGQLTDFNTGSIHRASYQPTDFTLVELDDPVSETADAFFAGWDARDILEPDTLIAVHHPSTDEKRISFQFDGTYRGAWGSGATPVADGNHLIIPSWDEGTTEGGSSGSPLFDSDKRVVGQLHGGGASCTNDTYDSYGWFHDSWIGGGTPATRLSDWLDPDNTGTLFMDGRSQLQCSFFAGAEPTSQSLCAPDDASFAVSVNENFAGPVTLSILGLDAGLTATFDQAIVAPGGTTTLTISGTAAVATGTYTFTLHGTDGTNESNQNLSISVSAAAPLAASLSVPADMAEGQSLTVDFNWDAVNTATSYDIEIATDAAFTDIIATQSDLTETTYTGPELNTLSNYYWRVRAHNICGEGAWSSAYSFETGLINCSSPAAEQNLPATVGPDDGTVTTSVIEITASGTVSEISLSNLDISHTYIGDLDATLTSPMGTVIVLFGESNCSGEDISVGFDDNATATAADFAGTCDNGPAVSGEYQPLESFDAFVGEMAAGEWILTITDNFNQDGGQLNGWNLDICTVIPNEAFVLSSVESIDVCVNESASFDITLGPGFEGDITLSGEGLPASSTLSFETNPATAGSTLSATVGAIDTEGAYTLTIMATDGTEEVNTDVTVNVVGVPAMPVLMMPANSANDVALTPSLEWSAVAASNNYNLVVSTQADLSDPIVMENVSNNDYTFTNDLAYGTTYYWAVISANNCGESDQTEVFSFTTQPDISVVPAVEILSSCLADPVSLELAVGAGLTDDPQFMITANPTADFSGFSVQAEENGFTLTWNNWATIAPGTYNLTITIQSNGYMNSASVVAEIIGVPSFTNLEAPANEATLNTQTATTFEWATVASATEYLFELASDDEFNNILISNTQSTTSYTVDWASEGILEEGQYYWRVTTINDCGESVAAFNGFDLLLVGVHEVNGAVLDIHPNPTNGPLRIALSGELTGGDLKVNAFAANGQKIANWTLSAIAGTQQIDLSALPAGAYYLTISNEKIYLSEKIILIK